MRLQLLYVITLCILSSTDFSLNGSQEDRSTLRYFTFKPLPQQNKSLPAKKEKSSTLTEKDIAYLQRRQKFFEEVDKFQLEESPKKSKSTNFRPLKRAKINNFANNDKENQPIVENLIPAEINSYPNVTYTYFRIGDTHVCGSKLDQTNPEFPEGQIIPRLPKPLIEKLVNNGISIEGPVEATIVSPNKHYLGAIQYPTTPDTFHKYRYIPGQKYTTNKKVVKQLDEMEISYDVETSHSTINRALPRDFSSRDLNKIGESKYTRAPKKAATNSTVYTEEEKTTVARRLF